MLSSRVLGQSHTVGRMGPRPLLACATVPKRQALISRRAGWHAIRRSSSTNSSTTSSIGRSSVEAGENKTGHIHTDANESIFFLDNIFPLKLQWMMRIPFVNADRSVAGYLHRLKDSHISKFDPMNVVKRSIPENPPITINEIIPRVKEGGAYIKFAYQPQIVLNDVESTWKQYLKDHPIRPIFNPLRRVRGNLVKGRPWIEDLARFPSQRVKIEFLPTAPGNEAAELNEEQLFSLLRKYGKIFDISPQPTDSKVMPRYATVTFKLSRHAVMAKNCMHGFTLPESHGGGKTGTQLKIGYERIIKAHWIRDWITSHPRVVLPILAAIAATVAVAIFDPIRTFFIKAHVSQSFQISDSKVYRWIMSQINRANKLWIWHRRRGEDNSLRAIWDDRADDIEQIKTWLMESADTFIVIQGPRGSGKRELVVDQALAGRAHTLLIDCKPIREARGDSATIGAAAKEVGYRPVFSWMNSFSSMIDLAAQGTIGTKTGFSETLDAQLAKILANTSNALRQIALEGRRKDDKDADLGEDEWLEAHPERRPAVVIDNFLHKSTEGGVVYDKISEWAAAMTTANIAHVIFLTHDVSFSKALSKALPDRVFRQIALGDTSPEVAKKFVIRHLDADAPTAITADGEKPLTPSQKRKDLQELDECIDVIGGRLTDLEFLARRIKGGESPKKAVQEIIEQSASEILKMYILDPDRAGRSWSPIEAWYLIKSLASASTIRYNEVLLSDIFPAGDATLQALEQAELISIVSVNGRPHTVKPGKPVYSAAFRHLLADHVLQARLDLLTLTALTKVEGASIDKYEAELNLLGQLPKQPAEAGARIKWLLAKLQGAQARIEGYEVESGKLKKVLQSEY